ncbi:Dynein heavy chain-like protein [Labeo rohita]|uniref:Dynein heavy chain-like protein n=1 Tax=Labeo rohita TaxID=84645 RepID=A0ABQ8L9L6_LABRO|nr:Dynein heavy chain-like protein [Labeo rohita]
MPQTSSPATHQEHLETLQSTVMDILQPKAANNLQWQRKEQQDCDTSGHLTPSLDNQELTSIIFSLVHTLKGHRQEVNELKLQVTEFQREPTPAQQEKEQDRRKEPDRMTQQKEITSLQEALTAARHREQLEKTTRQDLERELSHTKSLLRTAYMELNERDTRVKALEGHLNAARAEVQTLTQQFCNIKEELDMVQRELKQSYRLFMDLSKRPPAARHTASSENPHAPVHRYRGGSQDLLLNTSQVSFQETSAAAEGTEFIQTNSEVIHEVTLKELNRMARNIPAFTPELAGDHDVHAYMRDIEFFLQSWKCVNYQDRLYLLWITSSPEVRRFLARQPGHIQSDYQQLRQAIIKEFSDPESEHGLIAALDTKQGRYETPHVYYHRLRRAYFGARNEPGMEEDTSFKSLFLQNLHPIVSHHLGILACPHSMPIQQLRDLTHKAFNKHKASTKGVCKNPLILDCTTQNSKQAPEGTQHCHNARPFYRKTLASRGHNHRHGNRPRFQTNHWEEPWKRASSACKHHGMSNSSQPHPPSHPSHRC